MLRSDPNGATNGAPNGATLAMAIAFFCGKNLVKKRLFRKAGRMARIECGAKSPVRNLMAG
jgi:hypothetical protein